MYINMKKVLLIFLLLFLFSCKNDMNMEYSEKWIKLYQSSSKDLSIIDVDLNSAWVSFWMVNSSTWKTLIDYEKPDSIKERFYRFYAKDVQIWNNNKVFAMINWQFFNALKNPTFLSFPLKSNWRIINSYIDNDITKRTLIIDKDEKLKIFDWYNEKYLVDTNNKELIVAFNPNIDASKDSKIGRTYIWIKWDKNIIFFISKSKTQDDMLKVIKDKWISSSDIIMLDWWPLSQFWYFLNNKFYSFYWEWPVPQYNIIYRK